MRIVRRGLEVPDQLSRVQIESHDRFRIKLVALSGLA